MQPNAPTELIDLLRTSVVFNGVAVRTLKVRVETVDGCTQMFSVQIPAPVADPDPDQKTGMTLNETATEILRVLRALKPGEWMKGASLAHEVDQELEHTSGTFVRAVALLREQRRIESSRANGYRLLPQ